MNIGHEVPGLADFPFFSSRNPRGFLEESSKIMHEEVGGGPSFLPPSGLLTGQRIEEVVGGGPSCLPPSDLLAGQRTPEVGGGGRRRPLLPSSFRTPGWSDMRRAETSQEAGRRRVGGENGEIRQSWNYLSLPAGLSGQS